MGGVFGKLIMMEHVKRQCPVACRHRLVKRSPLSKIVFIINTLGIWIHLHGLAAGQLQRNSSYFSDRRIPFQIGLLLTLKAPITIAADNIHKYYFIVFFKR